MPRYGSRGASSLFLYTDRCSDVSWNGADAAAAARAKAVAIHVVLTQRCPQAEPFYRTHTQQTGGQLLRVPQAQTASTAPWLAAAAGRQRQSLLHFSGDFAAGQRMLEIPVDSTIEELTVSVSADALHDLQLLDPLGAPVPGSELTRLSSAAILAVTKPAAGTWSVRMRGSGDLDVRVTARSPIGLGSFHVVEERGREPGSFFPIRGPLQAGPAAAEAALYGPGSAVQFDLRSLDGSLLQTFRLDEGAQAYSLNRFRGPLELPSGAFRVYAHGVDSAGFAFTRVYPLPLQTGPQTGARMERP